MNEYRRSPVELHDVVVAPFSVRMLGAIIAVFGLSLAIGNLMTEFDPFVVTAAAIGVGAGAVVCMARVSVRISGGQLVVWFVPLLRISVPVSDVRDVSVLEIEPRRLGGVGIARHRGRRVLCVSAGRGVRFSSRYGTVLAQCTDADAVGEALIRMKS